MDILVCYDVNTQTAAGRKRLRRVARCCLDYGQRVQYSVFECTVTDARLEKLRQRLLKAFDAGEDSLRIYLLGPKREEVVEAHGRDAYVDFTEPLVI